MDYHSISQNSNSVLAIIYQNGQHNPSRNTHKNECAEHLPGKLDKATTLTIGCFYCE